MTSRKSISIRSHRWQASLFFVALLWILPFGLKAQCYIEILVDTTPTDDIAICIGDSISIKAIGECVLLEEDFNNMAFGSSEWSYIPTGVVYDNPCMNSSNGTSYVWFGPNTIPAREVVTNDFDVLAGGYISFDLRFGMQGNGVPCDGPDAMREGVSLQYSTDFGDTWDDIAYFAPTGNILPANPFTTMPSTFGPTNFTSWDTYTFPIPPGAQTAQTRFRFIQYYVTYYNGHYDDNWGLDNVKVARSISLETRWQHGPDTVAPGFVQPQDDSTYIVYLLDFEAPYDTVSTDSLFVDVHPIPAFEFISDTNRICYGDSLVINVSGNYNYIWNNGVHGNTATVEPSEETTYSVTSTDNIGCFHYDSLTIFVEPLPDITLSPDTVCAGDSATLTAEGGVVYEWNDGFTGPVHSVQPPVSTLYKVSVTGSNNCSDTASVMAVVHPLPDGKAHGDTAICYGDYAGLWASGGQEFNWSNGIALAINEVAPRNDTWFSVTVTDHHDCSVTDSVLVRVNPHRQIIAGSADDTICRGTSTLLNVSGLGSYEWSTGEISPEIEVWPGYSTIYSVTASYDYYGAYCSLDTNILVSVEECNTLHVANAFNPEGITPSFKPVGNFFSIRDYYFTIYDRWGKMVFETTKWDNGWDGRVNGDIVPNGVYVYFLRFTKEYSNESFEKIGTVTVIR